MTRVSLLKHLVLLLLCCPLVLIPPGQASTGMDITVHNEDISVSRYAAQGEDLLVFFSSAEGSAKRTARVSAAVADLGIEVWHVDLADSLFLPAGTATQRSLDGKYVAGVIAAAHRQTGKRITVMARSYGAIPVLRGIHQWQVEQSTQGSEVNYLSGAILMSPELYSSIPDLGLDPVYAPVVHATNIPIVLLQGGNRSNRWQLDTLLEHLQQGGAMVYASVLPGVTGMFYDEDNAMATQQALLDLPDRVKQAARILTRTPTPLLPVRLNSKQDAVSTPLDLTLKPFKGNPAPLPLDLFDASGTRVTHNKYFGKITVINFWASWCKPCVEEIPSLNRLREKMKDKPFELISVDYAEDMERIRQFMNEVNVDFPVLLDTDGKVSAQWNVLVFPSTFVIGPDGKIVYGVKGGIIWDDKNVVDQLTALLSR